MFQEIDTYIDRATEQGYSAFLALGSRLVSFITQVVLTSAAKGQTTLSEHLSKSGFGGPLPPDDDDGETDSAGEAAAAAASDEGDAGDPPRRRRRGRGRSSASADADESANEILRAAYRREVAEADSSRTAS